MQLQNAADQIRTIPLSLLFPSPKNVRKSTTDSIDELKASIASMGLKQNLNVERVGDRFEVVAGGRRLRALKQLVSDGVLDPDHLVLCIEVDGADAAETSAAENLIREPMHPADEVEAFKSMVEDGRTNDEIAARFGHAPQHVDRMLRLANVSPVLFEQFRSDEIELDQMMALAITDDHQAQEKAWAAGKTATYLRRPDHLRKLLTETELLAGSTLVRYVGVQAYKDAGGAVRQDVFAEPGTGDYLDATLVRKLATAKLKQRADQLVKDGWSWAEVRIEFSWQDESKFSKAHAESAAGKQVWPDVVKQHAGCIVTLGHNGKAEVKFGLVKPKDKEKLAAAMRKAKAGARATTTGTKAKPAKKPGGGLPFVALQRLQGIRTGVVRDYLATHQHAAIAALAASLYDHHGPIRIGRRRDYLDRPRPAVLEGIQAAPTADAYDQRCDEHTTRIDDLPLGNAASILPVLLASQIEKSLEILQFCAAEAYLIADVERPSKVDAGRDFLQAIGLDMAAHWSVTPEWLGTLQPGVVRGMVLEACGKKDAASVAKLKGPELAKRAAELLTAKGWLPEPLQHPAPKKVKDGKQKAAGEGHE